MNKNTAKTRAGIISGLAAAVLDMSGAVIVYAFLMGLTTPQRVMQSVAAGALGKTAYSGGWNTAMVGLGFHTLIALIFAGLYVLIFPWWTRLFKTTFIAGLVYGCLVWSVMNFGVLPIATGKPFAFQLKYFLIGIGLIIFCVGMPIAFITRAMLRQRR